MYESLRRKIAAGGLGLAQPALPCYLYATGGEHSPHKQLPALPSLAFPDLARPPYPNLLLDPSQERAHQRELERQALLAAAAHQSGSAPADNTPAATATAAGASAVVTSAAAVPVSPGTAAGAAAGTAAGGGGGGGGGAGAISGSSSGGSGAGGGGLLPPSASLPIPAHLAAVMASSGRTPVVKGLASTGFGAPSPAAASANGAGGTGGGSGMLVGGPLGLGSTAGAHAVGLRGNGTARRSPQLGELGGIFPPLQGGLNVGVEEHLLHYGGVGEQLVEWRTGWHRMGEDVGSAFRS